MAENTKTACVPKIGDYQLIIEMLLERCLGWKILPCPAITRRTVEIGSRNSPDMVCTPFKITLGNFIEAAERGANVFVMPGSDCRLGLYDILQAQILSDMGFDAEMLTLFDYIPSAGRLFKSFKDANPKLTQERFDEVLDTVVRIVLDMDALSGVMRRNMAFEVIKGGYERLYREYLGEVKAAENASEAQRIGERYKRRQECVEIEKPEKPVRIGIIGEIYVVIEPSANCFTENWLIERGVEVVRPIDLTRIASAVYTVEEQIENSGGYVKYNIGSTANDSFLAAYEMAAGGIDGIIHMKPSACSPEITAMTVLQNLSRDFNVPIMYLTFDTETSEAGLHTRLEAFCDMLLMRRK